MDKRTCTAKRVNGKQRAWIENYYRETGFDCMWQEELDAGTINFHEFALRNIQWYELHTDDVYSRISHNIPAAMNDVFGSIAKLQEKQP